MRFFIFIFLVLTMPAFAENASPLGTSSDKPVAIEADQQLEWLREQNKFRATGNISITQGDTVITGDTAEALYDPAKGPSALLELTVTGNVVINSGTNKITSETATYDTRSEILNLRGKQVTLTSPTANVVSQNGMDYFAKERKAVSKGHAIVTQKTDKLQADQLTAWMGEKNELKRVEARGNVIITQVTKDGTSIAQAQSGDYDAAKNSAILIGNVKLTQGENHMQGDKATIDLATGYSTLQNNAQTGGRVRAIFTPKGDSTSILPSAVTPQVETEQPYAVSKK